MRSLLAKQGHAEKTDKRRKDDLIDEILNLKHKEWLTKRAPTMTSLAEARALTKKRKRWENENLQEES